MENKNKDKEKLEQLINKLNLSEEEVIKEVIQIPIIPELWEDKDEDYKEALEKYFDESNLSEEEKEEIRKELL